MCLRDLAFLGVCCPQQTSGVFDCAFLEAWGGMQTRVLDNLRSGTAAVRCKSAAGSGPRQRSPHVRRWSISIRAIAADGGQHGPGADGQQARLPSLHRIQAPTPQASREHPVDVDQELWTLLDLCTHEELEEVYNILWGAHCRGIAGVAIVMGVAAVEGVAL